MGILGLTHDERGAALEQLPVTIKVAIGEGPEPGKENSHPRRLDHFVFKRKTLRGQDVVWFPAQDIAQAHAKKPTELGIILLNDDPREVFRTEYALWTPSGCKCHGELVQIANGNGPRYEMRATRRTQKHPEGEAWPGNYKYIDGPKKGQPLEPCGHECPDLERGDCRPSGDLYFILEKFPTFGAICRLHTSSYRSIRNLSNGLMQIRRLNGGRLTGIKAILKASPERVSYSERDGTRHTSVAYILNLEVAGSDLQTLVDKMTASVRFLGNGHTGWSLPRGLQYVAREQEAERASEIAGEFYPDREAAAGEATEPNPAEGEREEQLARIRELARRLGLNEGLTRLLIGQAGGDFNALERRLLNELRERSTSTSNWHGGDGRRMQSKEQKGNAQDSASMSQRARTPEKGTRPSPEGFVF